MSHFLENKSPLGQLVFLLLFVLGSALFFTLLGQVLGMLLFAKQTADQQPVFMMVEQMLMSTGIFLLPALLFARAMKGNWFSYNRANACPAKSHLYLVFFLSFVLLPVVSMLGYLNEQISLPAAWNDIEQWIKNMEEKIDQILMLLLSNHSPCNILLCMLTMAVVPAICEEFFFRGTLQPFFTRWFSGYSAAIWVTAFIFSAIHLQFAGFIPRFLLGVYLGYLYRWGGSLWLPVFAHFLHNAFSLGLWFYMDSVGMSTNTISPTDFPSFIPLFAVAVLLLPCGLLLLYKKRIH
ncbi:MAG: CPBP family intramembrane metalloprotease [Bacteroidales bacterium]|jgi:membrane protease YdiL (CAAX protease family)|nr:CPBP family intramembrane metalloprotease [Bacteroidales bacterium]